MIVTDDWLILQPPHTASNALHDAACKQAGAIYLVGPTPDGSGFDQHTTAIANGLRERKIAIVVRDPFDRAVGLWHHLVNWNAQHGDGCSSFATFAQWLANDDATCLSWMYRYTIDRWLGEVRPDTVLRFERLVEDLAEKTDLRVELPNMRSDRRAAGEYYRDAATAANIVAWASQDFSRWNYSSEPPRPSGERLGVL